ncbi:MAG: hypothetical protein AAGC74_02505 [Verrucomicrobiota bacterium]
MNPVVVTNPEVEAALRRQKARATFSSLIIALLAIVLFGLGMGYVLVRGISLEQPSVVAYKSVVQDESQLDVKQLTPTLQRKPSAPSSSTARVIASQSLSSTAIPVPDVETPIESLEFGDGDDFGAGWGSGDSSATAGGSMTFFGQEAVAERVAFVIDYSASMYQDDRVGIMKDELSRSIRDLNTGIQYQMIFFAGPVWVAGGEIADPKARKANVVTDPVTGSTYQWRTQGESFSAWKPRGAKQKAQWLTLDQKARNKSLKDIKKTPLVLGTRWKYALEMALDMDPPPNVIFFMTDGSTGKEAMEVAESVGRKGKSRNIQINCVAMMEPKAHEAMKELAKRTGGDFTVVLEGGRREKVPVD